MSLLRDPIEQLRDLIGQVWGEHRDAGSANHNGCDESECAWCQKTREAIQQIEAVSPAVERPSEPLGELIATWRKEAEEVQSETGERFHPAACAFLRCAADLERAALSAGETPQQEDGIRFDSETQTYVVRHTIITAGRTEDEAKEALASAVKLTAQYWPPHIAGETPATREQEQIDELDIANRNHADYIARLESKLQRLTAERSRLREQIAALPRISIVKTYDDDGELEDVVTVRTPLPCASVLVDITDVLDLLTGKA